MGSTVSSIFGGGGGSSSPPAVPDYQSLANQTAANNLKAAQAATAANRVIDTMPIGANDTIIWDTALVLAATETLQGLADTANKVNVTAIGWEKQTA